MIKNNKNMNNFKSHNSFDFVKISEYLQNNPTMKLSFYKNNKDIIDNLFKYKVTNWKEMMYLLSINRLEPDICICGKNKMLRNMNKGYFNTCGSNECKNKIRISNTKKSNLKKYGVTSTSMLQEVKEKIKQTNLERYGVVSTFQSESVLKQTKDTLIKNYGVDSPLKSPELQKKRKRTMLKRHGVIGMFGTEKQRCTMLKKYGNTNPMLIPKFAEKQKQNHIESKLQVLKEKIDNTNKIFISEDLDNSRINLKCKECKNIYSINRNVLNSYLKNDKDSCPKCNYKDKFRSNGEISLYNFCVDEFKSFTISQNRKFDSYEVDVFFDNLNIALEYNGVYWHSEEYKDKSYHQKKSEYFEKIGINLIHVWEDDWILKTDIIKNIIKSKINPIRIGGRQVAIRIVDYKTSKEFHEKYHLDGYSVAKYHVGLFYKNELISLASFGKARYNNDAEWELIRYTTKDNYSIIGGFSKILKYFKINYKPKSLKSYKKLDLGTNNFYEDIGFEKIKRIKPNYFWVVDNIRINRQNFQRHKLKDIKDNETEISYMHNKGYRRVYDSGSDLFIINFDI